MTEPRINASGGGSGAERRRADDPGTLISSGGSVPKGMVANPARAGLVLDFDGTLCTVSDDPLSARVIDGIDGVLRDLADRFQVVAILSGRPAADLATRVTVAGARLLGVYGMEEWISGRVVTHPQADGYRDLVVQAREMITQGIQQIPKAWIRDKGLAIAVHWQNSPDRLNASEQINLLLGEVAASLGMARAPGRFVEDILPSIGWDKGVALSNIHAENRLESLVYIGDDIPDLAAFEMTRKLGGTAIFVEGHSDDERLRAAADHCLPGPAGVAAWLSRLRDGLVAAEGMGSHAPHSRSRCE